MPASETAIVRPPPASYSRESGAITCGCIGTAEGEEAARGRPLIGDGSDRGSGTVLGSSIDWPNQVFWIFAIVPSPSILTIAALTASISVLSSSRPTQEK